LAELRSLVKQEEQVRFFAISVDSPAESKQFAEQIAADGKGEVNFAILSDPAHRVIDAYGVRDSAYNGQKFEGIPHATVYLIDKDGRVAWTRVETDYKRRPNNEEVESALKSLRVVQQ
jgi:peroxiredoxin